MGGHVARIGKVRNVYKICIGKPEGKRTLGRPNRRRVVKDLMEIGWRLSIGLIWLRIWTSDGLLWTQ
jgi:hypothetical protein